MLLEYGFPPEVQKWIVGKRIAGDDDTLTRCGIKTSGLSMFLYLISPRSGLTKTKLMNKYKHLLPTGNFVELQSIYLFACKTGYRLQEQMFGHLVETDREQGLLAFS